MATVGSSLSSALTVFKGSGTGQLTQLYRGGTYVPNLTAYAGVDNSGAGLALSQLVGLVSPLIYTENIVTDHSAAAQSQIGARVNWYANGQAQILTSTSSGGDSLESTFTWLLGGSAGDYGLKVTSNNGINTQGMTTGVAYQMNSTLAWVVTASINSEVIAGLSYSIVDYSLGTTISSSTYSVNLINGIPE